VSADCRSILAGRSLSFRLAAGLLPRRRRDDAAVLYAWCRRCDDAVDERPAAEHEAALAALHEEVSLVYAGGTPEHPVGRAFAEVVRRYGIPPAHPLALLEGMTMDARGVRYRTLDELRLYAFRVAGVVGLMMAPVLGLRQAAALRHAADLGMAMQLTNICRDVREDWERGRVYIPDELLGGPLQSLDDPAVPAAVRRLLAEADRLYRSGDRGLACLPWRCALAIGAARRIYHAIGTALARRGHDVLAGRAVVSGARKLFHVAAALLASIASLPARLVRAR
jgi:phytoene synthase